MYVANHSICGTETASIIGAILLGGSLLLATGLMGGCGPDDGGMQWFQSQDTGDYPPDQVARMAEPDVTAIYASYDPYESWILTDDRARVRGIKIGALYLIGKEGKGVFGKGVIRPRLYLREEDPDGQISYRLIKQWSFDMQEAMPFRSKRKTLVGWGYSLFLTWDDLQVDLTGEDIRIVVGFERADGIRIGSRGTNFRVPAMGV